MSNMQSTLVFTITMLLRQLRSDDEIVAALLPGNSSNSFENYVRVLIQQLHGQARCAGCSD